MSPKKGVMQFVHFSTQQAISLSAFQAGRTTDARIAAGSLGLHAMGHCASQAAKRTTFAEGTRNLRGSGRASAAGKRQLEKPSFWFAACQMGQCSPHESVGEFRFGHRYLHFAAQKS